MIPGLPRSLLSASRVLTGETLGALGNPEWDAAEARVLIARLSPVRDVDRSSSHLILFSELRGALPRAYIDFAFFPDRNDRDLMVRLGGAGLSAEFDRSTTKAGWPWFFGGASGFSPSAFDLVLVSNAFGLELVNLPWLFSTAGIPLRASERAASPESLPIVILGGSNAAQASAIVEASGDSLADGLFFGEGEGAIGPLAIILADRDRPRGERLLAAASIEGFWPALHPELRARRRVLHESPPPLLSWPPLDTPEAKTARLQITAGCPGHCSFCFEGWDRRPYRELPLEALLEAAREIKARNGTETLEIYSFNFNTHAEIFKILYELGRIFKNVNLMSQRLDILAGTRGLVAAELAAGKRSFTLGIEGISARMRSYYRKGLPEEGLSRLVELLCSPEVREIKLFYIISGLEDEGDTAEFAAFARSLSERKRETAPGLRILVSAGYLVRLPGTPLGHAPLIIDEKVYATIAKRLAAACGEAGIEWRLAVHFDEFCADQIISLGGGGLLPWFEGLVREGPSLVYDGSLGKGVWPSLEKFARSRGILGSGFLEEKGPETTPFFPFLEGNSEKAVLYRDYLAAKAFIDRESCLGGRCSDCGACPDVESRLFLTKHRIVPQESGGTPRLERLALAKRGFARILVEVERPVSLAGASREAQEAWLLALLSSLGKEAPKAIFSARLVSPLPEGDFGLAPGSTGWSIFALEGPSAGALAAIAKTAELQQLEKGEEPSELALTLSLPDGLALLAESMGLPDDEPGEGESGRRPGKLARGLLAAWLARSRIAYTERREGSLWRFEIAARDLARRAVFSACAEDEGIEIAMGPRARLASLGAELGPGLAALLAARVRLLSRGPSPRSR